MKNIFQINLRNRIAAHIFATERFLKLIISEVVEVFKTSVRKKTQSKMLLRILCDAFPSFKINFDMADRDKVLRVEGENIKSVPIIVFVKEYGFDCEVLD